MGTTRGYREYTRGVIGKPPKELASGGTGHGAWHLPSPSPATVGYRMPSELCTVCVS